MSRFTTRARELLSSAKKGDPIPRISNSVNAEGLWPASLEVEADKAASILRSFFCDGFIVPYRTLAVCEQQVSNQRSSSIQLASCNSFPVQIIRKCRGLAIFHVLRDGLGSPQASGSGVVVSRLADGTWSGPSTILVDHNPGLLSPDTDALDVVLVINSGMKSLSDSVVALQKCLDIAAGPIAQGGPGSTQASTWSYAKSKGERVEIDLSSLRFREAADENARFYGVEGVSGSEILSGQVKAPSGVSDHLSRTLHVMDNQSGSLSGLPKPGKCPGDRRIKAASSGT